MGIGSFFTGSGGGGELDEDQRKKQGRLAHARTNIFQDQMKATGAEADNRLAALENRRAPQVQRQQDQGFFSTYGGATVAPVGGVGAFNPQQSSFRGQQQQLTGTIMGRALGVGGPSVAEQQLQRGQDSNAAAVRSMVASSNSPHAGASVAQGLRAINEGNLQTNQQAAELRANEQIAAQGLAGGIMGQARQQDLGFSGLGLESRGQDIAQRAQDVGLATDQARLAQEAGMLGQQQQFAGQQAMFDRQAASDLSNAQFEQQNQQQIDNMTQYYMNLGMSADQASLQARQDLFSMYAGSYQAGGGQQGILAPIVGGAASGLASGIAQAVAE